VALRYLILFPLILLLLASPVTAQKKNVARLPAEKAGKIETATGKIAFIRNNDLWVMDWDGRNQFKVVTAQNADGSLSWGPNDKRIVFPRRGKVDVHTPDNLGGQHRIYDIFIGYLDTALVAQKTNWWMMITGEMGARYPKWSRDGSKIYFTQDLNANYINAVLPNYQTAWVDTAGGEVHIHRTDYNNNDSLGIIMPTIGPDKKYAFVVFKGTKTLGVGISTLDKRTLTKDDLGKSVKMIANATAPAWSPDGKWLAFIVSDINEQGIFITNPDLSENYMVFKPGPGQTLQTYPLSWAPNSKYLTFALGDGSIWSIDITGNGLKQLTGAGMNISPAWSNGM
jgi:Tol biopolymer transport system component